MVIRANILGYCMGVRRAVDTALDALKKYPNHAVFTLGPLIHNKTAIEMLTVKGIHILEDDFLPILQNAGKPTVVIIRAHGTSLAVKCGLEKAGAIIIDATCPRVLANQKRSLDYSQKGYTIFIAGDKSHGEVFALEGSVLVGADCYVLQNAKEATELTGKCDFSTTKAILISQTTITQEEYNEVKNVLQASVEDLIIFDTICPATRERQNALRELHKEVDGLLVIGGKNSANTQRLYQIAMELSKETCSNDSTSNLKPVYHIETAKEIPEEFLHLGKVGLTAGASTPDEVILQVEKVLGRT